MDNDLKTKTFVLGGFALAGIWVAAAPTEDLPLVAKFAAKAIPALILSGAGVIAAKKASEHKTAYHEAGHVLTSLEYKSLSKMDGAEVHNWLFTEGLLGEMTSEVPPIGSEIPREILYNEIIILMAGKAAELEKFGAKHKPLGHGGDLKTAKKIAYLLEKTEIGTTTADEFIANAEEAATNLLRKKRPELDLIANALYKNKRMSRNDILTLLGRKEPETSISFTHPDAMT